MLQWYLWAQSTLLNSQRNQKKDAIIFLEGFFMEALFDNVIEINDCIDELSKSSITLRKSCQLR